VGEALDATLGAGNYQILRTEAVGPKVGGELRQQAVLAILMSFLAVLAYLAYRFEWRFGVAAVVATAHDIIAAIAFIGLARLEVSLFVVAGLLTIVGYSLNDTIVIFDRIRENLHKRKRDSFVSVLNRSINETLPRTFFTGTTALGSLVALSVFGGDVVRPFALLMLFGVLVGTFSSIYIASPVLLAIETRWPGPDARGHLGPKASAPAATSRKPQPVG
jgi:preprotein translocase subunit SecF